MTRVPLTLVSVVLAVAGCKHRLGFVPCDPACPPPAARAADCPPAAMTPDCTTPSAGPAAIAPSCLPQVVETRAPETIHVKAPAEKITVILPPECPNPKEACATPPHAVPGPAMAYGPAPGYAPAYAPVAGFAPSPGYAPAGLMSSTQTVRPRNRIALGLDTIRVPLLVPKLFSVEREQEVVTRQRFSAPAAPQMAFAPAPQMAFAPAPQMAFAPAPQMALAPVPQMALAPAPQPQMAFAPAPQPQMAFVPAPQPQMMFAPQPQPQPQMMFAPQPQPQMMLAPAQAPAPPLQGMICVPTPGCQPACPTPAQAPCPADCPPAATSAAPLLQHLDQVQQRLDVMEHQYRARMGVVPAGGAAPAPLAPSR